jgi:hypothetical protein
MFGISISFRICDLSLTPCYRQHLFRPEWASTSLLFPVSFPSSRPTTHPCVTVGTVSPQSSSNRIPQRSSTRPYNQVQLRPSTLSFFPHSLAGGDTSVGTVRISPFSLPLTATRAGFNPSSPHRLLRCPCKRPARLIGEGRYERVRFHGLATTRWAGRERGGAGRVEAPL